MSPVFSKKEKVEPQYRRGTDARSIGSRRRKSDTKKQTQKFSTRLSIIVSSAIDKVVNVDMEPPEQAQRLTNADKQELNRIYQKTTAAYRGQKLSTDWAQDKRGKYVRKTRVNSYDKEKMLLDKHLGKMGDVRMSLNVSEMNLARDIDAAHHFLYGRKLEKVQEDWPLAHRTCPK